MNEFNFLICKDKISLSLSLSLSLYIYIYIYIYRYMKGAIQQGTQVVYKRKNKRYNPIEGIYKKVLPSSPRTHLIYKID